MLYWCLILLLGKLDIGLLWFLIIGLIANLSSELIWVSIVIIHFPMSIELENHQSDNSIIFFYSQSKLLFIITKCIPFNCSLFEAYLLGGILNENKPNIKANGLVRWGTIYEIILLRGVYDHIVLQRGRILQFSCGLFLWWCDLDRRFLGVVGWDGRSAGCGAGGRC